MLCGSNKKKRKRKTEQLRIRIKMKQRDWKIRGESESVVTEKREAKTGQKETERERGFYFILFYFV